MDIGSIFLVLALLILVILFISRPFFERPTEKGDTMTTQEEHDYSSLMAERDRILNALQELDFDHALGKIPAEDYPPQRAALLQQGTEILKKLDKIQSTGLATGNGDELDARIEAAIAQRRADAARADGKSAAQAVAVAAPPVDPDDDIEVMLANRRRQQKEKLGGFCPQCGGPVRKSDRFCPKCGADLG